MRAPKARYRLWQIMLAVAVFAGLFAAFSVTFTTAVVIVIGVVSLPILLARPGQRLRVAAWVASIHPLLLLFFLYATWFTAWAVLGHRPRSSIDNPKFISPLVEVPYFATFLLGLSAPLSLPLSMLLVLLHIGQSNEWRADLPRRRAVLMLAPILVFLSVCAILGSGIFGIRYIHRWYYGLV